MDTRITKVIALNILLIGWVLFLSGCVNQVYTPEVSPISPTLTITTSLPSATATVPATETQLPPYPTSSENFVKKPSISGAEAEKRIVELGVGEDLNAMKDWYRANGVADANMFPVLYEEAGEFYWNLAAKSGNGNFLKFTITSGAEADQVVRAMGMVAYLYTRPTFRTSELKTPDELNGTTQEMMWDRSGWSVVGTFKEGVMTGWYNADKNMWILENTQAAEATATPEVAEEMKIFLSEQVEYNGYSFNFDITTPKDDKIITDAFEKYWIGGLKINEDKPNTRELLAKTFIAELLETYNFQNKASVGLDEFMKNPGNYPAKIMMRNSESKIVEQTLTLDQVNSFELRLVSGLHGELYMSMPGQTAISSGYGFEDGKLILYNGLGRTFGYLDENIEAGFDRNHEIYPYLAGYAASNILLSNALGQMPYTIFLLVEHRSTKDLNNKSIFSLYDESIDLIAAESISLTLSETVKWERFHEPFVGMLR
ncbi:MAG: hypothetical protein ACYDGL_03295 [Bellilinea sp.]